MKWNADPSDSLSIHNWYFLWFGLIIITLWAVAESGTAKKCSTVHLTNDAREDANAVKEMRTVQRRSSEDRKSKKQANLFAWQFHRILIQKNCHAKRFANKCSWNFLIVWSADILVSTYIISQWPYYFFFFLGGSQNPLLNTWTVMNHWKTCFY